MDDAELDSGDDDNRNDHMQVDGYENDEQDTPKRELNVRETSIGRHIVPSSSDGEVSLKERYSTFKLTGSSDVSFEVSKQCWD